MYDDGEYSCVIILPDGRVGILWNSPCDQVHTAPQVGQLCLVYLPHLPCQHLAHGVKTILSLGGGEAAVEDRPVHGDLYLHLMLLMLLLPMKMIIMTHLLHCPAHGLLGSHRDIQPPIGTAHPAQTVPHVHRDGHLYSGVYCSVSS